MLFVRLYLEEVFALLGVCLLNGCGNYHQSKIKWLALSRSSLQSKVES